jgi:hypothetical protein
VRTQGDHHLVQDSLVRHLDYGRDAEGRSKRSQSASPASVPVPETSLPSSGSVDSHDVVTGVCIHAENPKFPPGLPKKKARREIVLHATITIDGTVKDVTVVRGDRELTDPAIEAVRLWQLVPSIQNGNPIESRSIIKVAYILGNGASLPEDAASDVPREPQRRRDSRGRARRALSAPVSLYNLPESSLRARSRIFRGRKEV